MCVARTVGPRRKAEGRLLFQVRSLSGGARVSGGIGTWTVAGPLTCFYRIRHRNHWRPNKMLRILGENRQFRVLRLFDFSTFPSFLYGC